jgi:tRNA A-37 threonylcarbamoyl transferase component Bud32
VITALLDNIRRGERNFDLPCVVELAEKQTKLEQCLRLLPNKRAVFLAYQMDSNSQFTQPLILKIFLPNANKDYRGELAGYSALSTTKVPTPRLLGDEQNSEFSFIFYQYISSSRQSALKDRRDLSAVVDLVQQMHLSGIVQDDIHPDNFIIDDDGLAWVIDCGSIKSASAEQCRENIALFVAQFSWRDQEGVATLAGIADQLVTVRQLWWKRCHKYLKKIFRDCTEICVRQNFWQFAAYKREHAALANEFLANPDAIIAKGSFLKDGNSATVVRATLAGQDVVIKRYNLKNWRHAIDRSVRPSRAWNAWRAAHLLEYCGLQTPGPLLLLERRIGILRRHAYLITAMEQGEELLDVYNKREPEPHELDEIGSIFSTLRETGIHHGDLKATNLMLTERGVTLIDLDVLKEEPNTQKAELAYQIDRQRFLKNWQGKTLELLTSRV